MDAQGFDWKAGAQTFFQMNEAGQGQLAFTWVYSNHHYEFKPRADGTFQVRINRPGTYELSVEVYRIGQPEPIDYTLKDIKARGSAKFTIEKGSAQESIDLGKVELKLVSEN